MDAASRARFENCARIIKAVAHPTRLFLVEELSRSERRVRDLTHLVGADVSTVSKHLAVLRRAGILESERRGVGVFYRLSVPRVLEVFDCVEHVLKDVARSPQHTGP